MSGVLDTFIPLNRSFHELAVSEEGGDQAQLRRLIGREKGLRWPDLLAEARVILLSEAGSGKTEEIRHTTRQLRSDGRPAFFLRIEHVTQDLESCFEEGTLEEFAAWVASGQDGWVLLDSVDEARLRDPKDFERAIRKLSVKLRSVLQHAHIIITGRTFAWRPKTDLLLCKRELRYTPAARTADPDAADDDNIKIATTGNQNDNGARDAFRIVALDDLYGEQLDRFAKAKGVTDLKAFRSAIEKAEAWSFTTRPLDLAETIEFWRTNHRIGSRLELMRTGIARRLEERDQDRSEARPIAAEKILAGARLVAAAATLAQQSSIRVPDGQENSNDLLVREVLTDWDDVDCATLLSRPIFDEGIYGTVRFHHRSVREYLTAEWLHTLIVDEGSRKKVEGLFFRKQYGIEVIVPTMRPILPWLALLDGRILERVVRLAPEVLFEGGDPVGEQLVEEAFINRLATGRQHAFPGQLSSQRRRRADLGEALEDHPHRRRLLLVDDELAVADNAAEGHGAAQLAGRRRCQSSCAVGILASLRAAPAHAAARCLFLRPKKIQPFQRVPVIARATAESDW